MVVSKNSDELQTELLYEDLEIQKDRSNGMTKLKRKEMLKSLQEISPAPMSFFKAKAWQQMLVSKASIDTLRKFKCSNHIFETAIIYMSYLIHELVPCAVAMHCSSQFPDRISPPYH